MGTYLSGREMFNEKIDVKTCDRGGKEKKLLGRLFRWESSLRMDG